jgi:hypothetical protein
MNKFLLIIVFYFLMLFQVGFISHFSINYLWPNLVLLAALIIFLNSSDTSVLWLTAIWSGFLMDVFYYQGIGWATISMGAVLLLSRFIRRRVDFGGLGVLIYIALLGLSFNGFRFLFDFLGSQFNSFSPGLSLFYLIAQTILHLIIVLFLWLISPMKIKENFIKG